MTDVDVDVHAIRRYMKDNNLRALHFEDYGESMKLTVSYKDGKTMIEKQHEKEQL